MNKTPSEIIHDAKQPLATLGSIVALIELKVTVGKAFTLEDLEELVSELNESVINIEKRIEDLRPYLANAHVNKG